MSSILAPVLRPQVTRRRASFSRLFIACGKEIARYFVRRAAMAHLRELDDRALRDIGLTRSQIEPAVYGFITRSDRARM